MGESYVDGLKIKAAKLQKEYEELKKEREALQKEQFNYDKLWEESNEEYHRLQNEKQQKLSEIKAKMPGRSIYFFCLTVIPCKILSYPATVVIFWLIFGNGGWSSISSIMQKMFIAWIILEIIDLSICIYKMPYKGYRDGILGMYFVALRIPFIGIMATVGLPGMIKDTWEKLYSDTEDKYREEMSSKHNMAMSYHENWKIKCQEDKVKLNEMSRKYKELLDVQAKIALSQNNSGE